MKDRKDYIKEKLEKCKKYLEEQGYNIAYVCVYGSQNYGLDLYTEEYKSDLDFKAVIIPTLDDLVYNSKPISTTIEYEGGQIDLKDIRSWVTTVIKGNPAYIETLYSKYKVIDERYKDYLVSIFRLRFALAWCLRAQFARAVYGMAKEKEAAFEHPYPSCIEDIEKFAYSRKQLHHIVRLYYLLNDFVRNSFLSFEPPEDKMKFLIDIKTGKYSYKEACKIRDEYIKKLKVLKDKFLESIDENKIDYRFKDVVNNLSKDIIKKCIVEEVKKSLDK